MLRLERMEVTGFKSFPERTVVEFPDGVTAVVGPNGSGKSNIADAINWVIGEQSARALRGRRMEDVIFAGSDARGPGGMAEVTLHLVARNEPLPDGRTRVSITRRLYRTGESEYLVDGKRVRLQDVRALLEQSRVGARTYAVIDQGRVAAFVTARPQERRLFIEEAAGIAGYKRRRRQAELKLEATRANLLRVDDILREVERQRRSLKRQAAAARRARRLDEEIRALRGFWIRRRVDDLAGRLERAGQAHEVARREGDHVARERDRLQARLEAAREVLEATRREREAKSEELHRLRLELERAEREIASSREQAEALRAEAARRAGEGRRIEEERRARERELAALEERLEKLSAERRARASAVAEAREAVAAARRGMEAARQRVRELEEALHGEMHRRADLAARLAAARQEASRERDRHQEALATRDRLAARRGELAGRLEGDRETLRVARERVDELAGRLQEARAAEEAAGRRLEEARAEEARLAAELAARSGEKAALDSLEVRLAGADPAREVLEKAREGRLAARSVLADLLEVDGEVEAAAESFLGRALPAVVVEGREDVLAGLGLGIRGEVTFLPLDAPSRRPCEAERPLPPELAADPRVRGRLAARLRARAELNGQLSCRLEDAVLVEDLATALDLHRRWPDWNYLSPEGHVVHRSGLVTLVGEGSGEGLLARARRREELAREVGRLETEMEAAAAAVAAARERLSETRETRARLEAELAEASRKAEEIRLAVDQGSRDLERLDRETAFAAEIAAEAERAAERAAAEAESLAAELTSAEGAVAEARERLAEARRELEAAEEKVRVASDVLADRLADERVLGERVESTRREAERVRTEIERLARRREEGEEAAEAAARTIAELARRAEETSRLRDRLREQVARAEEGLEEVTGRLREASAAVHGLEERLDVVLGELEGIRARRERFGLEVERLRSDLAHVVETCREELGVEPRDLAPEPPEGIDREVLADERWLSARLEELRGKRQRIGVVNPLAEQEYDELSARFEELSSRKEDLESTIAELTSSIRKMDRESRDRFLEAWREIRRHFKEQFAILFRGGKADLVLEDENDPLESGIEIVCQPPGKKLQSVSLLSGGEKALVATAMLFAIFRYQPPPFCLLDEVDAPLDEANVSRFTEVLRGFTGRTQFILITHNKRTMEMADVLYGVTMPEPGISRLVAMSLD